MNTARLKKISSGARTSFALVIVGSPATRQNPNPLQEISLLPRAPNTFQPIGGENNPSPFAIQAAPPQTQAP